MGHPEGYTATDIVARYKRMRGFDVLHPMGWDAFGLPAEQHAIETGTPPAIDHRANIATFKRQLKMLGFCLRLVARNRHHRSGLLALDAVDLLAAVQARSRFSVRDPGQLVRRARHGAGQRRGDRWQERTGRVSGRCACHCGSGSCASPLTPIGSCRISKGSIGRRAKKSRRNWIGRSEGAEIDLRRCNPAERTRDHRVHHAPRHAFGCTYMVLAPEHPLIA